VDIFQDTIFRPQILTMPREEFRLLKLILHSELRRRAASRRALPCPSSLILFRDVKFTLKITALLYNVHVIRRLPVARQFRRSIGRQVQRPEQVSMMLGFKNDKRRLK